jgi:hypothetical protein
VRQALIAVAVAAAVALLLYVRLDAGLLSADPTPHAVSLPLGGLAVLFGLGAWAAAFKGQPTRTPFMAGLALGVGGYALLRVFLF